MVQIPLYHRGRETGQLITVDDHLSSVISRVHWSTGDIRRPQSPRHVSRLHGEPFTVSLNRLIYALSHNEKLLSRDIFDTELGLLKYEMSRHPPLVFEDDNVLNCTLANIIPRALSHKGMKSRTVTSDVDSTPPHLSQNDVTVSPQAVKMIQYGEKGVGKSDILIPPGDDNLSKLFSHLDASSDPSISRTNDTNKKGTIE
jgi:hypothetical protein